MLRPWKWIVWKVGGFLLSFWGLNWPENSSSFPPPWGRGRHVRSQRVGCHRFPLRIYPWATQKKTVLFPRNAQKNHVTTRVCRATTTSSSLPIATAFNILWLLKGRNDMEEMQKNLTDSSLLGEKTFALLFNWICFVVVWWRSCLFLCWRVLILVFSGEQVGKAYDSGWILECWTYHSVYSRIEQFCMIRGMVNCFAIAISIHVPSQEVNFLIPNSTMDHFDWHHLRKCHIIFGVWVFWYVLVFEPNAKKSDKYIWKLMVWI